MKDDIMIGGDRIRLVGILDYGNNMGKKKLEKYRVCLENSEWFI